jgi:outer membrane lipoprotein-sorting protein
MRLPALALLFLAACGGSTPEPAPLPSGAARRAPTTGTELIERMHEAYASRWYRTLTFVQTTKFADGRVETWHEALAFPGNLRIDVAPISQGKMSLFRNDSLYTFENGEPVRSGAFVHPLLVLGFDVYADPPAETIDKLRAMGLDLAVMHMDSWQGRPSYVVGAAAGDTLTPQFWIDAERLVFTRLIERRQPAQNAATQAPTRIETQFNDYRPLGGGWIAPEVVFIVNGEERLREEYADMRADVDLPAGLFEPVYAPPAWVQRER